MLLRLENGDVRDEIKQSLYDTIDFDNAASPKGLHIFFDDVKGKSLEKTNLRQPRMLETATSFKVQALGLDAMNFRPDNALVIPLIMERSSLTFRVAEKAYWTGPARFIGGRMWQHASLAQTDSILQQWGFAAVSPVQLFGKHQLELTPLQSFWAEFNVGQSWTAAEELEATPAATTVVPVVFSLKGLLRRIVQ